MRFERKKNLVRSVSVGFVAKISDTILQFALRTIMINTLGVLYLGLNSLFTSILGILSLTELGFGNVIIFSMYKPIAEDDNETVKSLLAFYQKCYKAIGGIILAAGLICTPFITTIINGEYPQDTNIYILYLINLLNTVLSYFLFAYRSSILEAHQRNDLVSFIDFVTNIIKYGVQITLLIILRNYYAYLIIAPITTICRNLLIYFMTNKYYPDFIVTGAKKLSPPVLVEIKTQIKGVVLHKFGNSVAAYADSMIISAFWGLSLLGIYNNYYYIVTAVNMFVITISNALIPGVGNSLAIESKEKNVKIFKTINFYYYWLATIGTSCFVCMFQPFMELWVGANYMFPLPTAVLLSFLFYVAQANSAVGVYKGALGMWWQDKFRPLISAGMNLMLNIVLSYFIGINGVIISTIIAKFFVDFPYVSMILFKNYFEAGAKKYILGQYIKALQALPVTFVSYLVISKVNISGYAGIATKLVTCLIVSNLVFCVINIWDIELKNNISRIRKLLISKITSN